MDEWWVGGWVGGRRDVGAGAGPRFKGAGDACRTRRERERNCGNLQQAARHRTAAECNATNRPLQLPAPGHSQAPTHLLPLELKGELEDLAVGGTAGRRGRQVLCEAKRRAAQSSSAQAACPPSPAAPPPLAHQEFDCRQRPLLSSWLTWAATLFFSATLSTRIVPGLLLLSPVPPAVVACCRQWAVCRGRLAAPAGGAALCSALQWRLVCPAAPSTAALSHWNFKLASSPAPTDQRVCETGRQSMVSSNGETATAQQPKRHATRRRLLANLTGPPHASVCVIYCSASSRCLPPSTACPTRCWKR